MISHGEPQHDEFRSDGEYIFNDWEANPNGEGYKQAITAGRPDLQGRVEDLRASVKAVNEDFAARYGWDKGRGYWTQDKEGLGYLKGVAARYGPDVHRRLSDQYRPQIEAEIREAGEGQEVADFCLTTPTSPKLIYTDSRG